MQLPSDDRCSMQQTKQIPNDLSQGEVKSTITSIHPICRWANVGVVFLLKIRKCVM